MNKETMSLFAKEADGRKPKGALYDIIYEELGLKNDFDFIDVMERDYIPYRHKVASLQLFAKKAALKGDEEAKKLYVAAASQLADSAKGIISQLGWEGRNVTVSYFGGLFKNGELILNPLKEMLDKLNCTMTTPKHTAVEGSLLLCIKIFN